MKKNQENKYNMYVSTLAALDEHSTEIASIGALADSIAQFRSTVNEIADADQAQATPITGVSSDKREARDVLIDLVLEVAGAVQAYASTNQNRTLFEEVDFSKTDLMKQSDSQLPATAQIVHDAAQTNLSSLADYNIDAPKLAELATAINEYRIAVPMTRVAITARKSQTDRLDDLFETGDALVKERIDKLMQQFKSTNTVVYTDYSNARVIVDAGIRHTVLKGKVTDAVTGDPLVGAKVTIVELDRSTPTGIDGVYAIKEFQGAIYTVRAELAGYQPLIKENIELQRGQNLELNFELVKS